MTRFAVPTYYGSPARALAGYLEIRSRRAESLVEVPAICETAIRGAYLCRGDASPRLATARHGFVSRQGAWQSALESDALRGPGASQTRKCLNFAREAY